MATRRATDARIAEIYALALHSEGGVASDVMENIAEYLGLTEHPRWDVWVRECVIDCLASLVKVEPWALTAPQVAQLETMIVQSLRLSLGDPEYAAWAAEGRKILKRASHG